MPDIRRRLAELASEELRVPISVRLKRRLDERPHRLLPTVTIGRQTYREVDNGRANVLVPIDDPLAEERRRGIARFQFQTEHPLGSALYALATLAGASPQARDRALAAGGLIDTGMLLGIAPRVAPSRALKPQLQSQVEPLDRREPDVTLRDLNASGQAMGVNAWITSPRLGTGTKAYPRLKPPGWRGDGRKYNEARGHLYAKSLGGTGKDMRNLVTLTHRGANTPQMSNFEKSLADRVRAGEVIEYSARPFYDGPGQRPSSLLLTAYGSRGAPAARLILNPAHPPK